MSNVNKAYLGNQSLKSTNVQINYTKEQLEEYIKCSQDPIYFIEKYIKIVSLDEGLIKFEMRDFQKEIIRSVHENRFTICKIPRQSGKTTCVVSYFIWFAIFYPNSTLGIIANKATTAKKIMDTLKISYENLPGWISQGITEYNKNSITFENGSTIIASATSSTTARSNSYSCVLVDEFAFVPQNIAEQFFSAVYPTITSGSNTKIIIISTPNGMNHFHKMWSRAVQKRSEYVPVECHWYDVPGRGEEFKKQTIANTSQSQWDQEFECQFLGSTNTLVSGSKLATLDFDTPLTSTQEGVDVYSYPEKDHIYCIGVDTSRGQGEDYHAFVVIDVTTTPYKLVCKFRNNTMSHQLVPNMIKKFADYYNESMVIIEINDLGQSVAETLHNELEYPNIVKISQKGNAGQRADAGFGGGKLQMGLKTTHTSKMQGCNNLKDMIENDKLIIRDFDIISELSTFVSNKTGYAAAEGDHDDLVSSLVIFAWLTTQGYFKDQTDSDIRTKLFEEHIKRIEEQIMPFGFRDDGSDSEESEIDIFDDRSPKERKEARQQNYKSGDW